MVSVYQRGAVFGQAGQEPTPNTYTEGTLYSPTLVGNNVVWDNAETIQYFQTKIGVAPSTIAVTVQNTLWTIIKKKLLDPTSPLIGMDNIVVLPSQFLNGITPKSKDVLERADGTQWAIGAGDEMVQQLVGSDFQVAVKKSHGQGVA